VAATAPTSTAADAGPLAYPQSDRDAQVPLSNLRSSRTLIGAGAVFARLLTANTTVDDTLARVAMLGSSTSARGDADLARARTESTTGYVRSQLARVRIEGPQFVMMSGESGPIQVTLVNDLDQPVTVGLRMTTPGSNLRITPVDPVRLGPGRRTSLRLAVSADDIGVHAVTLATTDPGGTPLGSQTQLSVRTSHVSTVIWVVMGIGAALLFLAVAVRLFRRIRRRQATHGPLLPHDDSHRRTSDQEQNA
jgi:hypothetical protein